MLLLHYDGALYPGSEAVKHFKVLNPATEPERFGELELYKLEVGTGAVVCMANVIINYFTSK